MPPILDIVCVAQGRNTLESHDIPDPGLTLRGKKQRAALRRSYPYMAQVKLIISSPLRRAIDTARAFSPTHSSDGGQSQILLLPELQETSARPSDTGSPLSTLKSEYGTRIDTSKLKSEEWCLKGSKTDFFPSLAKVEERARKVRFFLRHCAKKLEDGDRIVVITHGAFAHFLVHDFAGLNVGQGSGVWPSTGFRSFEFIDLKGQDIGAPLKEIRDGRDPTPAYWFPVSEEQFIMQKSYAVDRLRRHEREARTVIAVKNE